MTGGQEPRYNRRVGGRSATKQRQMSISAQFRKERRSKGLCISCGKPHVGPPWSCDSCRRDYSFNTKLRRQAARDAVLAHYGAVCKCCGEDIPEFLSMDHINGDGGQHRRSDKFLAMNVWRWLVIHNFPDNFRVLCFNCNHATSGGRVCPHQTGRV